MSYLCYLCLFGSSLPPTNLCLFGSSLLVCRRAMSYL